MSVIDFMNVVQDSIETFQWHVKEISPGIHRNLTLNCQLKSKSLLLKVILNLIILNLCLYKTEFWFEIVWLSEFKIKFKTQK